jgi:cell division septation protein DedD
MKNKEFREIQISSSLLVFIFLGVLALGVFVFLLGVSVGKKQAQIAGTTTVVAEKAVPVETKAFNPPIGDEASSPDKKEMNSPAEARKEEGQAAPLSKVEDAGKTKGEKVKPPPAEPRADSQRISDYFVQVGAFVEQASAGVLADRFKAQGYSTVVVPPSPSDRNPVFKVRLGGFDSREKAADVLAKLNAAAGKKTGYYIVKE